MGDLELGGWDVTEFAVETVVVEPFDVGEVDVVDVAPWSLAAASRSGRQATLQLLPWKLGMLATF